MKKQDFKAAIDQIEEALKGNDPAPNSYDVRKKITFIRWHQHGFLFFLEILNPHHSHIVFIHIFFSDSIGQIECNIWHHS